MSDWLKEKRLACGYTQETIADKAGIAKTTYASYEQGQRNPSVKNAKIIASILGFSWTIFFENKVHKSSTRNNHKEVI